MMLFYPHLAPLLYSCSSSDPAKLGWPSPAQSMSLDVPLSVPVYSPIMGRL